MRCAAMTGVEWAQCDEPFQMLGWVGDRLDMRLLRLYAVASCRRLWPDLDERCRQAVEAAEAWADRAIDWRVVSEKRSGADLVFSENYLSKDPRERRLASMAWACRLAAARTR